MAKSSVTKTSKGGGPQTEEGKKIASRNSLKMGVYSKALVLPGESEADFRQIEEQFIHDFDPRDMAEIAMVRDLAILAWKKVRLENLELRFTLDRLARPLDSTERYQFSLLGSQVGQDYLRSPSDYTLEYQQTLEHATAFTEQMLQRHSAKALVEKDLDDLIKNCPILADYLANEIGSSNYTNPTAKNVLRYTFINDDGDEESFLASVFKDALHYFENELKCFVSMDEIRRQSQALQDRRLMSLMENPQSSRAFDDLRRNLFRTLGELRKHQEWRRKLQAINLADQSKTVEEGGRG